MTRITETVWSHMDSKLFGRAYGSYFDDFKYCQTNKTFNNRWHVGVTGLSIVTAYEIEETCTAPWSWGFDSNKLVLYFESEADLIQAKLSISFKS